MKTTEVPPPQCPFCKRPNYRRMDHHLIPKCYGGSKKEPLCRDCHRAIHAVLTNKQLRDDYHTVEALLSYEPLRRMIKFISKQDPTRKVTMRFSNDRPRKGKYG